MRILLFAFVFLPLAALAQPAPADRLVVPFPRTLTVSGDGTVEAPPDRAIVRFAVVTEGVEDAQTLLRRHEEQVQAVLTAVRNLGIADRQIRIEGVNLHERYIEEGRRQGFTAYRSVSVTVDDLRRVPELVAAVVAQGANRLEGLVYTLQDPARYEDEALDEAVARAREKAARLAAASGVRLARVLAVQEAGTQPPVMPMMQANVAYRAEADGVGGAYSAGSSEVRAAVVVTFELE